MVSLADVSWSRGVDRPGGEHERGAAHRDWSLPALGDQVVDPLTCGVDHDGVDAHTPQQSSMTGRAGRVDRTHVSASLVHHARRESRRGATADARTAIATIDAHGIRAAVDPLLTKPRCEGRNVGLVLGHKHVNPGVPARARWCPPPIAEPMTTTSAVSDCMCQIQRHAPAPGAPACVGRSPRVYAREKCTGSPREATPL